MVLELIISYFSTKIGGSNPPSGVKAVGSYNFRQDSMLLCNHFRIKTYVKIDQINSATNYFNPYLIVSQSRIRF